MPNDFLTPGGLLAEEIAKFATRKIEQAVAEIEAPPGKDGRDGLGFDLKIYSKGQVHREGDYVVTAWGKIYVATRDTADEPRKTSAWKRVGPWGLEFIGLKPEDTSKLECGDLYIDGGSLFGVLPDGRVKMLAQRGKEGKQGPAGKDGKDGRHGASPIAAVIENDILRFRMDDGTEFDVYLAGLIEKLKPSKLKYPIGTVLYNVSKEAPEGFLPCDGSLIPSEFNELKHLLNGNRTPRIAPGEKVYAYVYAGEEL